MHLKEELYNFCKSFIEARSERIHSSIATIQESMNAETKSSAGDKHETGRAMLQLEREKLGYQLKQVEEMGATLSQVSIENNASIVRLGSFVKTTKSDYFIAVSAGVYDHQNNDIFCISIRTPVGQLLFGKTIGDSVTFRNEVIQIVDIQ